MAQRRGSWGKSTTAVIILVLLLVETLQSVIEMSTKLAQIVVNALKWHVFFFVFFKGYVKTEHREDTKYHYKMIQEFGATQWL